MDLVTFRDLLTPRGQETLQAAMALTPREADFLSHFQTLCKSYPRELARGALEIAVLRGEAKAKFPQARRMYFTREALEQASNYEISAYRAERYRGYMHIADLGCSVGSDTLALSDAAPVVGLDRDPLRLAMAKANLDTSSQPAVFIQNDLLTSFPCLPYPYMALFFDPTRRIDGRRVSSVSQYQPPLSKVAEWLSYYPAIGVKVSPAVKQRDLFGYDAEVEFISLGGKLKEAVLWFGPLKTGQRRATVLPGPHMMVDDVSIMNAHQRPTLALAQPLAYFYEPDPAVIRAGMVQALMVRLGAAQVDPEIAYLTADKKKDTPFARIWAVEAWFPFQLKRLRAYLRERNVGPITVKKRGSPIIPEDLIQALHLKGEEERVVFLTQMRGNPIVIVCYPEER